jgi:hypothetical protein
MKQMLEDYYREVEEKAEQFAQEAQMRERTEHLQAFNFGRIVQRTENSRHEAFMRVGWLLLGLAIGVAIGRVYPVHLTSALAHQFITKASLVVREMGKSTLGKFWGAPRFRA